MQKLPPLPWDARSFDRFLRTCQRQGIPYKLSLKQLAEECARAQRARGYLPDELRYLKGFTWLFGFVIDPEQDDVWLLGLQDPSRPPLNVDCLVTAMQAAYTGQSPGCSLNPHRNPRYQKAVIDGIPRQSRWAEIMIQADYDMKKVSQGQEDPHIASLKSWVDLMMKMRQKNASAEFKGQANRWWFNRPEKDVPRTLILGDGVLVLYRNPVVVMTDMQVNGKFHAKKPVIAKEAERFAEVFTRNLPLLARRYESIAELLALYRLLDLMVHLRLVTGGAPPPGSEYWFRMYRSPYRGPAEAWDTLTRRVRNLENGKVMEYTVKGGVRMPLDVDPKMFRRELATGRLKERLLDRP